MAHVALRSTLVPLSKSSTRDSMDGFSSGEPESILGDRAFMSMSDIGDFDDVLNQLGTGYAVASSKRNIDFHQLFRNIPEDDYLIEGWFREVLTLPVHYLMARSHVQIMDARCNVRS